MLVFSGREKVMWRREGVMWRREGVKMLVRKNEKKWMNVSYVSIERRERSNVFVRGASERNHLVWLGRCHISTIPPKNTSIGDALS
ncbi:hypothetical protein HanRHA438_Chr12g0540291 [Helianthus annuus]|nr:hypothetical protein HanRHA438_Chr12g0540291 [Helianthus annuus]